MDFKRRHRPHRPDQHRRRQYDDLLGRFISVDPVLVASDPDQYNGYQYGGNNPINNADPTGLYYFEDADGGGARAYTYRSNIGKKITRIVEEYVPPACNSSCQQRREAARQASNQRAEAARKQRECQASFWCRNAGAVGLAAGIAAGVVVGGACTAASWGVGAVGCAAAGGFVGGAVTSLVTNGLDADDETAWQLAGEALLAGAIGGALGAGGALIGGAAFGAATATTSGMGVKAAGQMAVRGMRSSAAGSGGSGAGAAGSGSSAGTGSRPVAPSIGQKIYRVYGGDSKAGGASWSPVDPRSVTNYRDAAGLPSGGASGANNTGRFVIEGILEDPAAVVAQRSALPLDGMKGGLSECIIPNWLENGSISLRRVSGVNPEF